MTRARVYRGLQAGDMERQSIYRNEREKLSHKDECAYCGVTDALLTLDHLFAKSRGGSDSGDNLVYCCQKCNSSKHNRDYFEWIRETGRTVNIAVAKRYLKNAYSYCEQRNLLDTQFDSLPADLPFSIREIPMQYDVKGR